MEKNAGRSCVLAQMLALLHPLLCGHTPLGPLRGLGEFIVYVDVAILSQ